MFLFCICSVIQVTDKTFYSEVLKDKTHPWLVLFGKQNDNETQKVMREFEDAAEESEGFAKFGYTDASKAPSVFKQLQTENYPVLCFFYGDKRDVYTGPRTARGMMYYIASQIGEGVEEAQEWWPEKKETENMVILFTKSFKPPLLLCAAQGIFKNRGILFGFTRDNDVVDAFGRPPVPSYWFYSKGKEMQYKGKNDIVSFLQEISKFFDMPMYNEL